MRKGFIALFLALALGLCALAIAQSSAPEEQPARESLQITLFDVGKADAILIETPDGAVMIDAGTEDNGIPLVLALREKSIDALDALIITHFDKDHVGGADAIINNIPVRQVIEPDYPKDSKQYRQCEEAMRRIGLSPARLDGDAEYSLAGLMMRIITAKERYPDDEDNDHSLVIRFDYGEVGFLFPGDIENPRLRELLASGEDLQHDFLKVPHHGRSETLSSLFFDAVAPTVTVITSSADEPEDATLVDALRMAGADVYLTREGDVIITCDGASLNVTQNDTKKVFSSALPGTGLT